MTTMTQPGLARSQTEPDHSLMSNAIDQGAEAVVAHVKNQLEVIGHLSGTSQVFAACSLRDEVLFLSRRMLAKAHRTTPSPEQCAENKGLRSTVSELLLGNNALADSVRLTLADAAFRL